MQKASCAWKTDGCDPELFYALIIPRLTAFFSFPHLLVCETPCPQKQEKKPQTIQPQNKIKPMENWNLQSVVLVWLRYKP